MFVDGIDDIEKMEKLADLDANNSCLTIPATRFPDAAVPFNDGPNVGRFRVTKRAALRIVPVPAEGETPRAIESRDKVKLVVVLLGWLGCQDRHLKKYAEMYHESMNCEVVLRHTVPASRLLRRKQWGAVRAAEEIMTLIPLFFPDAKVVVHYFSNGGCFVHRRMLLLQNGHYRQGDARRFCCDPEPPTDDYQFPQLAGTIFDSCPVAADAEAGARAVSARVQSPIIRLLMYATIRFGLEIYGIAQSWRYEQKYIEHIENDHTLVPSLYIFSEDDTITDPALVERVVAKRKAYLTSQGLPADVMLETWKITDPSLHVCHYARYPIEYQKKIKDFLQRQGLIP
ncbi:transmembrane protein 53-like [Nannochloropsis oceanica]